jgi:hypothetical protein
MQTAAWLVSRELSEVAGPWDTRLLGDDDKEYFYRVLLECDGVRFVPEARVYYRLAGPRSLSYLGRSDRKLEALWCSMRLHVSYLRSLEESERVRTARLSYLQTLLIYFYPERSEIVIQAEQLAEDLGGFLKSHNCLESTPGSRQSSAAVLPSGLQCFCRISWFLGRSWDKVLFRLAKLSFINSYSYEHK